MSNLFVVAALGFAAGYLFRGRRLPSVLDGLFHSRPDGPRKWVPGRYEDAVTAPDAPAPWFLSRQPLGALVRELWRRLTGGFLLRSRPAPGGERQ